MKFKARFSEVGAGWLEKRFLPAFEKLSPSKGVELVLLLTPETVHLIYDAKAQGGPEIHADFVVRAAREWKLCRSAVFRAPRHSVPDRHGKLTLRRWCLSQVSELFDVDTYRPLSTHSNKARERAVEGGRFIGTGALSSSDVVPR